MKIYRFIKFVLFSGFIEGFGVRIRPVVITDEMLQQHYPQFYSELSEQGEKNSDSEGEMGDRDSRWRSSSKRKMEDYDADGKDCRGKRRNFWKMEKYMF